MNVKKLTVLGLVVVVLAATAVLILSTSSEDAGADGALVLERPWFVDTAHAEEGDIATIGEKLDEEAGISAYYKAPSPINLDDVRDRFTTIEAETADYIIGSVSIPGYAEAYDVHMYVEKTGWMLAYYLEGDPASKIVDVVAATLDTDLFLTAMNLIAADAGIALGEASYYDFRFPNATNLLIVGEDRENGQDFRLTLPNSLGYFERSWSSNFYGYAHFRLNDVDLVSNAIYAVDYGTGYGSIDSSMMLPNVEHIVDIADEYYAAVAIVYRVP